MPEETGRREPPTYFANVATTILNVDEMTMEFRRYTQPHREILKLGRKDMVPIPPPKPEEIYQLEPVARVVLTFTAAKALKQYLDAALPQIEQQRKTL